mmetsp:Transcript_5703/g.9047  ORF Transcript_5703/g.9047 Transcript_5703/m.9047 type:complete len:207 (-) Transcript_5703:1485-2105(-)
MDALFGGDGQRVGPPLFRAASWVGLMEGEDLSCLFVPLLFSVFRGEKQSVLPLAIDFELAFLDDVDMGAGVALGVDHMVQLGLYLVEGVHGIHYLDLGPVVHEGQFREEVHFLSYFPLLNLAEHLLVVVSVDYCEDALVDALHGGSPRRVVEQGQLSEGLAGLHVVDRDEPLDGVLHVLGNLLILDDFVPRHVQLFKDVLGVRRLF